MYLHFDSHTCEPVSDGKIDVGLTGVITVKESVGCYVLLQDVKLLLLECFTFLWDGESLMI